METILTNGISLYLRWLFTKILLATKYFGRHLQIEYMAEVKSSTFGKYNKIYKYAIVRNSQLGDYTYIARNAHIENTTIGKFCCIGPNVRTGMGAHPTAGFVSSHPLFYSTRGQASGLVIIEENLFKEYQTTIIGNDVWIGADVIIKYGVKIGDGAIIAAGAVVSKDVAPYTVVGGVPAKLIKYRFTVDVINFLLDFKWWEKDLEWLKENKELFVNINQFIHRFK